VYGRNIHYKACGYFKGFFKFRYKCRVTDTATGISTSVKGYKSGKGAVEHAVKNLIMILIQRGIIPPPPSSAPSLITTADEPDADDVNEAVDDADMSGLSHDKPAAPAVGSIFCQEGDTQVLSRAIHYKVCGYFKGFFLWRYKCTATDVATGISAESKDHESAGGAVEHAVKNLITTLVSRGIIPPPPGALTITEVKTDAKLKSTGNPLCQDGNTQVYGRDIHFHACGHFQGAFQWRYKATATDVASGVSASVDGYKSGQGAVEHAVQSLFATLVQRGIIPLPPSTATDLPASEGHGL